MKKISLGILGLLLLVVIASGCTNTPPKNGTFTDGDISSNIHQIFRMPQNQNLL